MAKVQEKSQWIEMPLLLDWELDQRNLGLAGPNIYSRTATDVGDYSYDSSTIRQRLCNLLPQKSGETVYLKQRNTLTTSGAFFDKGGAVTTPRGIFWGNTINRLLEFWGTTLYVWSSSDTYTTVTSQGAATDGPGGFAEGINSSGVAYVFAAVVTDATVVTVGAGNTAVTDTDFPASIIPMPVYLDGYIFVAQQGTRNIYNSAVGDATSWAASTYIATEERGGNIVGLARIGKMVVALCENSVEFFRDAGIPAPNSPLQRISELTSTIGCVNRATIATHEDHVYFVGKDSSGLVGVFRIDPSGKIGRISSPSVDFLMYQHSDSANISGVITTWATTLTSTRPARAYMIPFHGKWYYGLHCNWGTSITSVAGAPISLLYDSEFKIWIELSTSHATGTNVIPGGWPYPFGTLVNTATSSVGKRFLLQNAYGGTTDTDLARLGNDDDYETADIGGGSNASVSKAKNIITWPLMSFGHAGRKSLNGVEIALIGSTAPANAYTISPQPAFIHHGRYLTNSTGATPSYTSYSLAALSFNPPQGELVHYLRTNLVSFYQQWFQLALTQLDDGGINTIRFRITAHEEQ